MKTLPSSQEKTYSVFEISEALRVHVRTVQRWIRNGELPARKRLKQWYVSESDFRDYQRKHPRRP